MVSIPGCTNLSMYLPDMWNQCSYRECVYGPDPWITYGGSLTIHDVSVSCSAGQATPLEFTGGDEIPCVRDAVYCVGRWSLWRLKVKVEGEGWVNTSPPSGRLKFTFRIIFNISQQYMPHNKAVPWATRASHKQPIMEYIHTDYHGTHVFLGSSDNWSCVKTALIISC